MAKKSFKLSILFPTSVQFIHPFSSISINHHSSLYIQEIAKELVIPYLIAFYTTIHLFSSFALIRDGPFHFLSHFFLLIWAPHNRDEKSCVINFMTLCRHLLFYCLNNLQQLYPFKCASGDCCSMVIFFWVNS